MPNFPEKPLRRVASVRVSIAGRTCTMLLAAVALCVPPSGITAAQEQKPDAKATREYAVAVGLQNKKLFPQAAARWEKFIQTFPADERLDRAHHYLGMCQLRQAEFEKAAATFRLVLERFPQFASRDAAQLNLGLALYNLAVASQKPDDFRAAAGTFATVTASYAQSKHVPAALYYQGECLYLAGDLAAATPLYEQVLSSYPQSELVPDARYSLATAQQELSLDEAAIITLQALITADAAHPLVPECRLRMGISQFKLKKFAEAATSFEQAAAIADFADADLALVRQASCLAEQGQIDQAVALYQTLPTRFPASKHLGSAALAAGKCLYHAGKFPEAQQNLATAIAGNSEASPEASYWLSKTLVKLAQPPAALAEADRALAAYAQSPFAPQLELGRIDTLYEIADRRAETVALYSQFAQQRPEHELAPQAAYMASLAALNLERYPEALAQAMAFLGNPKFAAHSLEPEVLFVAGESLVMDAANTQMPPDMAKAEQFYRDLITKHPMHRHVGQSRVRIGLCLLLAGKADAAVAELGQSLAALSDPAVAAEAHLVIGRAHQAQARYSEAQASLRQALATKPDWSRGDEVLLALAASLHAAQKPDEAVAELVRAQGAYPMSRYLDQMLYQLCQIAFEQAKFDESIARGEALLAQHPASDLVPRGMYAVARAKFSKSDDAGAVAGLTALVDRFATSDVVPQARYLRGLANQRLGQFQPALDDLQAFLAAQPAAAPPPEDVLDARYTVALCQAGLKQHPQAAATLQAILTDGPTYPRADRVYYELSFALAEQNQLPEAADAMRQLATRFPDSALAAEGWFRVGQFHEKASQWAEAAAAYTAGGMKAAEPELKERLKFKLGWVQYQAEQFPAAAATLQEQLQLFPQGQLLADATFLAGECRFRQDQFEGALLLFVQAVAQKSDKYLARALYRAGACTAALKQWPASESHYQALATQFPEFELIHEARYGMALAMQNQEKLAAAREVYEDITTKTDTETAAKARFMVGECAFREKKFLEAAEHFLSAALGYPYEEWQVLGNFEAARCFIELADNEKAAEALQTIIDKFPNHPKAKDAANLLAGLKK